MKCIITKFKKMYLLGAWKKIITKKINNKLR